MKLCKCHQIEPYRSVTNLNECIIFLIVALNCEDGFAWTTCANTHFDHLAVEEVSQVLLVDIRCDAANIEALGLPRQVRVTAYAHSECLDSNWEQETWNTENRQNLGTVSTREIEETCRLKVMVRQIQHMTTLSYQFVSLAWQNTAHTLAHGHPIQRPCICAVTGEHSLQELVTSSLA